jgi:hypothetical protein
MAPLKESGIAQYSSTVQCSRHFRRQGMPLSEGHDTLAQSSWNLKGQGARFPP